MKFEKHIEIENAESSAVDILAAATNLSKQAVKQAMKSGAVWLTRNQGTQRIRRADKVLRADDSLHLYYDDAVLGSEVNDAILVADETHYSIWYKPYGMLSQGSKWGDHCTINRWVEKNLQPQRPAFIVHRLDRAATGLMIIAHQKKIASYFSERFQQRQIEKQYQAIVQGRFSDEITVTTPINDKPAVSHIKPLDYDAKEDQSLVAVSIETGRKHQIRLHLSGLGFPIVGDRLYGDGKHSDTVNLCLTSCYLSFLAPEDNQKKIYTLPEAYHLNFNSIH